MIASRLGLFLVLTFAATTALVTIARAAPEATPPCTCGANARTYEGGATDRAELRRQRVPEPDWCFEEGRALLRAAYGSAPKFPPGFRGHQMTDFEHIVSVQWVTQPSPPRIVGSYRMASTLVHADTLTDARHEVEEFLQRGRAADISIPFLAASTIVDQQERQFFFEFLAPSEISGKVIVFRVWKSGFLRPSVGWLLADADRTGTMTIGVMPKTADAEEVSLFLESLWWENYGNAVDAKVLALPKAEEGRQGLYVIMPVASVSGGDWGVDDRVSRHLWKVRLDRRTGEVTRTIEPDILCIGKHNPPLKLDP